MKSNQSKIKLPISLLVLGLVVGVVYGGFVLLGKIEAAGSLYRARSTELLVLEKKQEHIAQLEFELARTAASREEVMFALLSSDEALDFIVRIENIARKGGLSYEVRILQEVTQESIDEELLALRRSRRKSKDIIESIEEKLPGITFSVTIEGSYLGIVRFMEGVASLPFYVHIESFSISSRERAEGSESSELDTGRIVQASVQMMVFTKK